MCFTDNITTTPVSDAPGFALKIDFLWFHGCPIGRPLLILSDMINDNFALPEDISTSIDT